MYLGYRTPGQWDEDSPSEQQIRKLLERMEEIEKVSKGVPSSFSVEIERAEARMMKVEEDARKERERVEAEHDRRLIDLNHRLQDMANKSAADRLRLEQETRERQRTEAELVNLARRLQDEIDTSGAYRRLQQEARERQRVEAEHKQQQSNFEHHLRDTTNASAADQAKWEGIRRDQAVLKENGEATRQNLEEQTRELHGQMEGIKKDSEGLQVRMKEIKQGLKEAERVGAEHQLQLADLTRSLQDETNVSAAHRGRLEQEIQKLNNRATATITMPPHPTPYVQVFLCLITHDG